MLLSKDCTGFAHALQSCSSPTLKNAYATKARDGFIINTSWTQTNYKLNKKHDFSALYDLKKDYIERKGTFPITTNPYILETISPTGKFCAGILKGKNEETTKEEFLLEIKSSSGIDSTFNLSAFDKHGAVNSDVVFGSLEWSHDENKIVYVAEKKKNKSVSFFEQGKCESKKEDCDKSEGEKYVFEESWGELLNEVINPVICVLDLKKKKLQILEDVTPEDISPAQPQFRGNDVIVFEGIKKTPFRLGRIYCVNRESQMYSLIIKDSSQAKALFTSGDKSTGVCPRVSPNGQRILFIYRKLKVDGDSHLGAENIAVYNLEKDSLIKIEKFEFREEMFSIFVHSLPSFCWFSDSNHVAIACFSHFKRYLCVLNTDTQKVVMKYECNAYFGVYADLVLTSYMKLDSKKCILQISTIDKVIKEDGHEKEDIDIHEIVDNNIISYGMIPKKGETARSKHPVILWIHGGPHVAFTDTYISYASAFCKVGFAVILVNYRGSTSDTTESLYSLPGKIGLQDVQDVKKVTELFLDQCDDICDRENIFLFGGSHGGFLSAHLIGQFSDYYRAAVMRNPLIDISAMPAATDIIDWTYFETGLPYQQDILPTSESVRIMLEKSPITLIKNIKAPILLCIGLKDARVPPKSQGIMYYKLLKANNKKVKMLAYPNDAHPLATVETEGDFFVNTCKWFYENGSLLEGK